MGGTVVLNGFYATVMGYVVGTINPSFLIGKLKGMDIRKEGSGNAGASNAVLMMGKMIGVLCAIFDIFKAWAVVKIAMWIFAPCPIAGEIAGTACVIGHIFPALMHFKGGKGLACLGGVIMAFHPMLFVLMFIAELLVVLIVDYLCIAPISAPFIYILVYAWDPLGWNPSAVWPYKAYGILVYLCFALVMLYKHMENLRRIHQGIEAHFSILWRREEEERRMQARLDEDETLVINKRAKKKLGEKK